MPGRFLPPHFPDFYLVKRIWEQVSAVLRWTKPRPETALNRTIGRALASVTQEDLNVGSVGFEAVRANRHSAVKSRGVASHRLFRRHAHATAGSQTGRVGAICRCINLGKGL